MKKMHGTARAVEPIPVNELEQMPTGALLARLKRLRWCEDGQDGSDLSDEEVASVSHLILFKSDEAWKTAFAELKTVLDEREHVERKL